MLEYLIGNYGAEFIPEIAKAETLRVKLPFIPSIETQATSLVISHGEVKDKFGNIWAHNTIALRYNDWGVFALLRNMMEIQLFGKHREEKLYSIESYVVKCYPPKFFL